MYLVPAGCCRRLLLCCRLQALLLPVDHVPDEPAHLLPVGVQGRQISRQEAPGILNHRESRALLDADADLIPFIKQPQELVVTSHGVELHAEAHPANDLERVLAQQRVQVEELARCGEVREAIAQQLGACRDDVKVALHATHGEGRQQDPGGLVVDGLVVIRSEEAIGRDRADLWGVLEDALLEVLMTVEHLLNEHRVGEDHSGLTLAHSTGAT